MGNDPKDHKMGSDPWPDLVIAILSVNNYPLEKTFRLFEALQRNGLFDPKVLANSEMAELARRLGDAGYNRGDTMTEIFVRRLASLGRLTVDVPIARCRAILSVGTRDAVSSLLSGVHGVGPKVLQNFFLLRDEK